MNNWNLSGKSLSLYLEFKKDGEFVQPDPGSIYLTIRNHQGTPISGYDGAVQPNVTGTTLLLTIPQAVNQTVGARENRFVRIDFTAGGTPLFIEARYKLTTFIPINATPEDVRNILGLREKELKDSEIDLYEAYFQLVDNAPLLLDALKASDSRTLYANRAIALKAAIELIPSMPIRTLKEESLNNASAVRASIDWELLAAQLSGQLSDSLELIVEEAVVSVGATPLLVLSIPIDPVTNA